MPRRRTIKSPPEDRRSDADDDDFFFDDTHSSSGRSSQEPPHRNAANARERARMRVLSKAFCRLKTTLPWVPADTKLSKLDTLRLAASYIAHLRALLHEPRSSRAPYPLGLAWPFAFQQGSSLSCTLSQRWNINHRQQSNCQFNRHPQNTGEVHDGMNNNDFYTQAYENDYEERYEDIEQNDSCAPHSCSYNYKEDSCYDIRNSHATEMGNM